MTRVFVDFVSLVEHVYYREVFGIAVQEHIELQE